MRAIRIAIASMLFAFSAQAAKLSIGVPVLGGDLCARGLAKMTHDANKKVINISVDGAATDVSPRATCLLALPASSNGNIIKSVQILGIYDLQNRVRLALNSEVFLAGAAGAVKKSILQNADGVLIHKSFALTLPQKIAVNGAANIRLNLSILPEALDANSMARIAIKSLRITYQ